MPCMCSMVDMYWSFGGTRGLCSVFHGGSMFLWIISSCLPNFIVWHTRKTSYGNMLLLFHRSITFVIVMTIKIVVLFVLYIVIVFSHNGFHISKILVFLYGDCLYSSHGWHKCISLNCSGSALLWMYHTVKCTEFIFWQLVHSFAIVFISWGRYTLIHTSFIYMTLIVCNVPYPYAAYLHLHISFPAKNPEKAVLLNYSKKVQLS
jgi:hypothetical protein